jgi:hypothetical protein
MDDNLRVHQVRALTTENKGDGNEVTVPGQFRGHLARTRTTKSKNDKVEAHPDNPEAIR